MVSHKYIRELPVIRSLPDTRTPRFKEERISVTGDFAFHFNTFGKCVSIALHWNRIHNQAVTIAQCMFDRNI